MAKIKRVKILNEKISWRKNFPIYGIVKLTNRTYQLTVFFAMPGTVSFPSTCSTCSWAVSSEDFASRKSLWDGQVETGDGQAQREAGREADICCQGVLTASCPVLTLSSSHEQVGINSVHVFSLLFHWRYQLPLLMQQYKPTIYQQLKVCWSFCTHAHSMHACRVKK